MLALGENTYTETAGNIDTLNLPFPQYQLARAIFMTGKPVVLVTFGGRPRIITEIAEKAQAVVLGFLPGMEGGQAMADILFGDVNPSGKMPVSYPRNTNDVVLYDHKPIEAFESNQYNPLYAFGHGLSYTQFETSGLSLEQSSIKPGESLSLSVTVTNTGKRAGQEVIMVYLHDVAATVTRPNKQLKEFAKVDLKPGESRKIQFELPYEALSFVGVDMKRIVEPGEFKIYVGKESAIFSVKD